MKITSFLLLLVLNFTALFSSCNKKRKELKDQMIHKNTICYRAINEKDTGWLRIDTSNNQFIGLLTFHYHNGKNYDGQFKGEMHRDTLKGYFDFKTRKNGNWHRNPVAFLKGKTELKMGVGSFIILNWGSAYFDDKIPIDYDKGRFLFRVEECR